MIFEIKNIRDINVRHSETSWLPVLEENILNIVKEHPEAYLDILMVH